MSWGRGVSSQFTQRFLLGWAGSVTRRDIEEGCGSGGWRWMGVFGSGLKDMWSVTVGWRGHSGVVRG